MAIPKICCNSPILQKMQHPNGAAHGEVHPLLAVHSVQNEEKNDRAREINFGQTKLSR